MCYQSSNGHHRRLHKIFLGLLTLGVFLPLELYLTGMALHTMYSMNVTMAVQGGLGLILFLAGLFLIVKGFRHHHESEGECSGEEKCGTCCK